MASRWRCPPRQPPALLADPRVIPLRERDDGVVQIGLARRGVNLDVTRPRSAQGDVVAHRTVEQEALLENRGQPRVQTIPGNAAQIQAVDQDAATLGVEETR